MTFNKSEAEAIAYKENITMYPKNVSGFSITMVEIISANISGQVIGHSQLSSGSDWLGSFICDVLDGIDASDIKLSVLDRLLEKNSPELKGYIYTLYKETVDFRPTMRLIEASEIRECEL